MYILRKFKGHKKKSNKIKTLLLLKLIYYFFNSNFYSLYIHNMVGINNQQLYLPFEFVYIKIIMLYTYVDIGTNSSKFGLMSSISSSGASYIDGTELLSSDVVGKLFCSFCKQSDCKWIS